MFKHRIKLNYLFSLNIFWIFYKTDEMNFLLFYFSYFVFFALGIGLGYHRIVCHGAKINRLSSQIFVTLGALCHVGSIKGSLIWHTQHHLYSDTEHDVKKNFLTALAPQLNRIKIPKAIFLEKMGAYKDNGFYKILDTYFYILLFSFYFLIYLCFGFQSLVHYFLAPSAMALVIHSYGSQIIHGFGYKNYTLKDNSRNSLCLLPFLFGENWHNNHHYAPSRLNFKKRFFEIDLIYFVARAFQK